jgi:CheY-specific phosphatase CheX
MANERCLRDPALQSACREAMTEVLETMFFEPASGELELTDDPGTDTRVVLVRFDGSLTGSLYVSLSRQCCAPLAAGFLGREEDELTEAEQTSLVAELGNMLCGATMSRMEPAGRLRIQQPVLLSGATLPRSPESGGQPEAWLRYPLECGEVRVSVRYGEP